MYGLNNWHQVPFNGLYRGPGVGTGCWMVSGGTLWYNSITTVVDQEGNLH